MVQAVALPDGSLVNFPDEMSHEDITKAMPSVYEQAQAKLKPAGGPGSVDLVGSALDSTKAGLAKVGQATDAIGAKSELGQIPNWDTLGEAAVAVPMAAANMYDTVRGATDPTGQYAKGSMHQAIDAANIIHNNHEEQTPYGGTVNFLGQALATPTADLNLVGQAGKTAGYVEKTTKAVGRGVENAVEGATTGATFGGEQTKPTTTNTEDLTNQSEQQLTTGATAGSLANMAVKGAGWFKDGVKWATAGWTSDKAAKKMIGENLPNALGEGGMQALENHVNDSNARDLDLTNVTGNKDILATEKGVVKGTAANDLAERRSAVNAQLANEVSDNLKSAGSPAVQHILDNTPDSTQAAETLANKQKLAVTQSHAEVNKAYDIDKAKQIPAKPDDQLKTDLEGVASKDATNEALISNDPLLDRTHKKYLGTPEETVTNTGLLDSSGNPITKTTPPKEVNITVGEQAQDIVDLRKHASNLYSDAEVGGSVGEAMVKRAKIARDQASAIEGNLLRMHDVTTADGIPVSQAVEEAKAKYIQHKNQFIENPDTGQINADTGEVFGSSPSATGKFMNRVYNKGENAPSVEGSKLLDSSKPGDFRSSIKNFTPNVSSQVQDKILSDIKDDGATPQSFDKYYSPPVQSAMEEKFPDAHKTIMAARGQSILDDIRTRSIDSETGEIDYDKFAGLTKQYGKDLATIYSPDQMAAHQRLLSELKQASYSARTKSASDDVLGAPAGADKANEIAIKSLINKIAGVPIGAAGSVVQMIRGLKQSRIEDLIQKAIEDPKVAYDLIQAAKAAPKDPSLLENLANTTLNTIPKAAGALTTPQDVRKDKGNVDKEIKDVTKPQSKNEQDENSILSQFSPVSDANASELESSKKNSLDDAHAYRVADAASISHAVDKTGIPEAYFRGLEKHEVQGIANPAMAKAKGNSQNTAFGYGQWQEKSYNDLRTAHPDLPPITDSNRFTVNDPRADMKTARLANGYSAKDNSDKMKKWLGRDPTMADGYGAHLMGLSGFKQFITSNPNTIAASVVPMAAKNNKHLFYSNGNPLTIEQTYRKLEDAFPKTDVGSSEPDND